jgi:4-hydroxy-2-oxoheptanedioate aldolase
MRSRSILLIVSVLLIAGMVLFAAPKENHLNPMVDLLLQHKPVFGIYAPNAFNLPGATPPQRGARGAGRGGAVAGPPPQEDPCGEAEEMAKNPPAVPTLSVTDIQTQSSLAKLALADHTMVNRVDPEANESKSIDVPVTMDYLFSGDFEGGVALAEPRWTQLMKQLQANGDLVKTPYVHLVRPVMQKAPKVGCDLNKAVENISRELNLGFSGLMFPHTQSAQELQAGLAAMRPKSKGGTRPEDYGMAPAFWGMSSDDYKDRADLYSVNSDGELVNFTIIEDKEGLAHRREIAAVKGIGVLWPGAGTLGGVFTKPNPDDPNGRWIRDDAAWEQAIQQVLAACKEFNVPCGYPANNWDDPKVGMQVRMKQGFSVFVSSWGDAAFTAVQNGNKARGMK